MKCVYCGCSHYSASCEDVIDPNARFEILKRDRRCFVSLKPDHLSPSCCHGNHYQSICRQTTPKPPDSSAPSNQSSQETRNLTLVSIDTENPQPLETTLTASSATKGTVLPQTVSAIARNEDSTKSTRVKLLFDSRYVTDSLKSRLGLKSKETETLHLNTFEEKKFPKAKM